MQSHTMLLTTASKMITELNQHLCDNLLQNYCVTSGRPFISDLMKQNCMMVKELVCSVITSK